MGQFTPLQANLIPKMIFFLKIMMTSLVKFMCQYQVGLTDNKITTTPIKTNAKDGIPISNPTLLTVGW